jgi:hypothetical protein
VEVVVGGSSCWPSEIVATSAPVASAFATVSRRRCGAYFGTSAYTSRPRPRGIHLSVLRPGWLSRAGLPAGVKHPVAKTATGVDACEGGPQCAGGRTMVGAQARAPRRCPRPGA